MANVNLTMAEKQPIFISSKTLVGGGGAYAASQTTVLHMKRLNLTESGIFVILCVFLVPKAILFYFYLTMKKQQPNFI